MVATAGTITLGKLIEDVRRQFGDLDSVQIQDKDIAAWAEQGMRQIVSDNPIHEATLATVTVPNQNIYTNLPADLMEISAVQYGSIALQATDFMGAMETYGNVLDTTGNPSIWYMWANSLYIYPIPTVATSLTVYYKRAPTGVTVSSDILGVPDRYYNALLRFVLARSYEKDEQPELLAAQETLFAQSTQQLANRQNVRGGSFMIVGDPEVEDFGYAW